MSQKELGIVETILAKLEEANARIERLESKMDRLVEICERPQSPHHSAPETHETLDTEKTSEQPIFLNENGDSTLDDPPPNSAMETQEISEDNLPTPPDFEDKELYRAWIDAELVKLYNDGLSYEQICDEMMTRELLTPKGKQQWYPIGVRGMLNFLNLQSAPETESPQPPEFEDEPEPPYPHIIDQDEDDDRDEVSEWQDDPEITASETLKTMDSEDSEPEALAPKMLTWEDDGYREYSRDIIFQLRDEGKTLKQIVEELEKIGIKTRSGLDRWQPGTISQVLSNEKNL